MLLLYHLPIKLAFTLLTLHRYHRFLQNSDFVNEPVKGFKKSIEEMNPTFVVSGVARGAGSLGRHTVGGLAGSAAMLTETAAKNMAVLTLAILIYMALLGLGLVQFGDQRRTRLQC